MAIAQGAFVQFELDVARFNRRLTQFLATTTRDAEQVIFETAAQVLGDTQEGWPVAEVDGGASRAAWWGPRKVAALAYQIGNPLIYSKVIEYGGYPGPGAKTERFSGTRLAGGFTINPGVFPRQKPQAPLRRALAKNYGELGKAIKASHQQHWGR